jgi:hypothetical protein
MSEPIPVFVNDRVVWLPAGALARTAVELSDPALGEQLLAGSAYLTDGRGIRLPPDSPVFSGAILRVVVSARQAAEAADADA